MKVTLPVPYARGQASIASGQAFVAPTCRFCGERKSALRGRVAGFHDPRHWSIWECMDCGVQFVGADEHEVDIAGFYEHFYAAQGPAGERCAEGLVSPWRWRRQARILKSILPAGANRRVLDIGCNSGQFLAALPADIEKHGVEVSERAAALAAAAGIHVHHGLFKEGLYPESFFSAVTAYAIIEHLVDPAGFLREVRRLLCGGGILALMTGDVTSFRARANGLGWPLYIPPAHQFFFSARCLDTRLEELGLSKVRHFYSAGGMVETQAPLLRAAFKAMYAAVEFAPWVNRIPIFDHYYSYYRLFKAS